MKTLIVATSHVSIQRTIKRFDWLPAVAALKEFCGVHLLAPVPWGRRVGRPWEWLLRCSLVIEGINVGLPTDWSPYGREIAADGPLYRALHEGAEHIRRDFPFDVILALRAYPDSMLSARLARAFGCPLVTRVRQDDLGEWTSLPARKSAVRHALGQSHRVIADSPELREMIVALGVTPEKVIVQPPEADVDDPARFCEADTDAWKRFYKADAELGKSLYAALASAIGASSRPVPAQRGTTP